MRYPPSFLDRLKGHFRLSEVIGQQVTLRRTGREFSGLCPFHNEKSPSFTVNDEKGFFHCFGCGAHGDVIGFAKDIGNISYREAVESLARQAGISLPQLTPMQRHSLDRAEELLRVCEAAAAWFSLQLRQIGGATAREYLAGRGIDEGTLREFRLGYAPGKRSALKDALLQRGFPETLQLEAGLLVKPEDGGVAYDKFRDRIMFPILDPSGRVVAFGGRLLDKEAKGPKYLNSPETPLFHKSRTLYRFDVARREAGRAGTLLLAEGYMDVIALSQAGLAHAVAPLGTAITREQLAMAWQVADEPVLCLDGDAAGMKAMERALELALPLLKPGKSLRFVRLPAGEDPDSLLRKHGAEGVRALIARSEPLFDLLWQRQIEDWGQATPEQAAGQEQALLKIIDRIGDPSVRDHYRQSARDRLYRHRQASRAAARGGKSGFAPMPATVSGLKGSARALIAPSSNRAQAREECHRALLALACHYPRLLDDGLDETLGIAEFAESWVGVMRDTLLACHAAAAGSDEAAVMLEQLAAAAGAVSWQRFTAQVVARHLPRSLRSADDTGAITAEAFRRHLEDRLELLHLEEEYAEAEANYARVMDERHAAQLDHLRSRVQELRHGSGFFPEQGGA